MDPIAVFFLESSNKCLWFFIYEKSISVSAFNHSNMNIFKLIKKISEKILAVSQSLNNRKSKI